MNTGTIILLCVLSYIIIAVIILYFLGKKAQKKQNEQQAQIEANKQPITMLVLKKDRIRMKDSGLPQFVIDQTPKYLRRSKLPIVKAKVGPQIISLVCDEKIFDSVPVKKEVKAMVSGIYIVSVRGLHGKPLQTEQKPKGFFKRTLEKVQEKAGAKPVK